MAYTTIDDPSAYFQTALYTGNGSSNAITNGGNSDLQPDWLWIKTRSHSSSHRLMDSSRLASGEATLSLRSEDTAAESDIVGDGMTSLDSDGFTLNGSGSGGAVNESSKTYVAWQWKANGGTRTTVTESGANPGGGHQSDTTAGFSIVDYVGTGGAGHITHGLGVVPEAIIIKNRDEAESWLIYHAKLGNGKGLRLDTTAAADTTANHWANTTPNANTIVIGGNPPNNKDAINYIAYCFASVKGYSKFGSYEGNGNNDGPFLYTGFKPAVFFRKRTDGANNWNIWDNIRTPFNEMHASSAPNTTDAEDSNTGYNDVSFLSNGIKIHDTGDSHNGDGFSYVYWAWAESPFVSSEGVPTTAR